MGSILTFVLAAAAEVLLSLSNPDGIYQVGDTVKIYATVDGSVSLVHSEVAEVGPYTGVFHYEDTCIGWVVAPQDYVQGIKRPRDFNSWWKEQLDAMRDEQMNSSMTEVTSVYDPDIICYKLEINCVGDSPVRGYIAMPRNAKKKSLPIVEYLHAAGVAGNWCRCYPMETINMAKWGNGCIVVNINAFGMENDREQAYYDELEQGRLKNYSRRASESRDDYFFKNMYLRAVRALDCACLLPQWDRKRVLAYGQSQGGAQAFALAGLDKRVTAVVGIVPAGCNSAGTAAKDGYDSWPFTYKEFINSKDGQKVMSYFDGCNFLGNTKAKLFIELGLMDTTCHPMGIYAALNQNRANRPGNKKFAAKALAGAGNGAGVSAGNGAEAAALTVADIAGRSAWYGPDVTILPSPWRYHNEPDPRYWNEWRATIYEERMKWVNEYLK